MKKYTIRGTYTNTKKGLVFAKAFDEPLQCDMVNACEGYFAELSTPSEDKIGIDYYITLPDNHKISVNAKMINSKYISLDSNVVVVNKYGEKEFNDYFKYEYLGGYINGVLYLVSIDNALLIANESHYKGYYIFVDDFIRYSDYRFSTTSSMQLNYKKAHDAYVNIPTGLDYQEIVNLLNPVHNDIFGEDFMIEINYNI